ncbi:hypothetical protein C0995_004016, partial [Termitomyces sp. Mi166
LSNEWVISQGPGIDWHSLAPPPIQGLDSQTYAGVLPEAQNQVWTALALASTAPPMAGLVYLSGWDSIGNAGNLDGALSSGPPPGAPGSGSLN